MNMSGQRCKVIGWCVWSSVLKEKKVESIGLAVLVWAKVKHRQR